MRWRFIHIPKNGGSSFSQVFGLGTEPGHPHSPASCFPDEIWKVALVRNPYDRAVSICGHILRGILDGPLSPGVFREWVASGFPTSIIRQGKPVVKAGYAFDPMALEVTAPQVNWISEDTHLLTLGSEESIRLFCSFTGEPHKPLPVANKGRRDVDYWPYYDSPTAMAVRNKYQEDRELLLDLFPGALDFELEKGI